ncbi:amino acid permease [Streptomyces sp. CB03238]|uniref:amino acid permease n=1 Tax=Streptomyces sp. CB03238 TaxID=1907777 RepID=UPI0019D4A90B|nr:amino acid permease [Streptomyces sp. CB03238]
MNTDHKDPSGPAGTADDKTTHLRGALRTRQMVMIAIGGVIGAGLFVGSGKAISQAGPAVLVAYAAVGTLVVLVMRMLGEMSVAQPETGSFSSYAGRELGPWAGLAVGWLYAYHWCVVIGFEAVAAGVIARQFLPGLPPWLAALIVMASLMAVNFCRVESYGSFEFWFAMIKVAAITVFLLIGLAAILGALPGHSAPGLANLTGQGGFAPNGWLPVLQASLIVFFSYFGTEAITIAAGEATQPAEAVRAGIRSVIWRILLFYIGAITVVVTLMPWNTTAVTESPFTAVLDHLGVPGASSIMNAVLLTAILSCLNSGLYSSSRMFYSLAHRGEAPRLLCRTAPNGAPVPAIVLASAVGLITVVANYFLPTGVIFDFLLSSSGSIAVIIYLAITVTHLRARARMQRECPDRLTVRMWWYPYLDLVVLAALLTIIGAMALNTATSRSLILTLFVTAIAVLCGVVHTARRAPKSG